MSTFKTLCGFLEKRGWEVAYSYDMFTQDDVAYARHGKRMLRVETLDNIDEEEYENIVESFFDEGECGEDE